MGEDSIGIVTATSLASKR